jgi:hypothetical protein
MDIEEMKKTMLEDPAAKLRDTDVDLLIEKVDNILEDVKLSLDKEEKVAVAPVKISAADKFKRIIMENNEQHIKSMEDMADGRGDVSSKVLREFLPQVIDNLAVQHFVGVQPMTGPTGLAYLLQYKFENDNSLDEEQEDRHPLEGKPGRRMSLEVISRALEAGARKLKFFLTIEAKQDMEALNTLPEDFNPARDIAKEIYEEIRNDISAIGRKETLDMDKVMGDATDIDQNMLTMIACKINRCANEIARNTRRGAGNFIITSETVAEILKHSSNFVTTSETDKDYGYVKYLGTLNGTIKVYSDESIEYNKAVIGYKGGNSEIDTGYIYAPYIMLMTNGVVVDPNTFQPLVTFMTRYGKLIVRDEEEKTSEDGLETTIVREPSNYYIELTFDNLPKLDALDFKKGTKEASSVEYGTLDLKSDVVDAVDAFDAFESAMELLS